MLRDRLKYLLRRLFHREGLEQDMDEELQAFYATMASRRMEQGATHDEAQRANRIEFGHPDLIKEQVRDEWVGATIDTAYRNLRFGLRLLRKSPGLAFAAIVSLSLCIGANIAIFTLVDTVLLRSLPVQSPEQLFFIDNSGGKSGGSSAPPYPLFEIMRGNSSFSGMAAFSGERFKMTADGAQESVRGQYASCNYFQVLGVGAVLGRTLTPTDDGQVGVGGSDGPVAVISYGLWNRRFARNPDVLGKTIQVGTDLVRIIGVSKPEFYGLEPGSPVDITIPITLKGTLLRSRGTWWFSAIGRLREGAQVEQARLALDRDFQLYMKEIGKGSFQQYFTGIALVPAARGLEALRRKFSKPLLIVETIVGVLMLIGCANVANLLLARANARREEIAMRIALGASRSRILGQLFTEGLILAAVASFAALLIAKLGVDSLARFFAGIEGRVVLHPAFDFRVFAFATTAGFLAALLFSIAPVWHSLRFTSCGLVTANARAGSGKFEIVTGKSLTVFQILLSAVLLFTAALFIRSLQNLDDLDPGFRRKGVVAVNVEAALPNFDRTKNLEAERAFYGGIARMWENLTDPARPLPGVHAASVSTLSPFSGKDNTILMNVSGLPSQGDSGIHINQVAVRYFDTLGIQRIEGRLFRESDRADSPRVAILSQSAAKSRFPGENAIGRRVTFPGQRIMGNSEAEIVGIVRDARYENLRRPPEPMVYVPIEQSIYPISRVIVLFGIQGLGAGLLPELRRRVQETVPSGFISGAATIQQQLDESLLEERLLSILAGLFGGLALLLAAIGIYGILSFTVSLRTREIGIRLAVGASPAQIWWLVLQDSIQLFGIGLLLAIPFVWIGKRFIESELFGLKAADPLSIGSATALLVLVALCAGGIPAWRAMRVEPQISLRHD